MNDFNSSYVGIRNDLLKHINAKGFSILDVGCANGAKGAYLKDNRKASYVVGIELDPAMAEVAETRYDKVYQGNLDDTAFIQTILEESEPFDCILIGDVLEHLNDPWDTLRKLGSLLKPDGTLIFSVPNVQHIDVFIHVFIKGYWPYNDRGIFDRTHKRWFTLQNIEDLANHAQLQIAEVDHNFRYRDRIGSKFPWGGRIYKRFLKRYFIFQYIVVCRHPTGASPTTATAV